MATRTYDKLASPSREVRLKKLRQFDQVVIVGILIALLILTMIPIILMVIMSLKDNGQIYGRFWSFPNPVRWP
ncbi:MAG: hypothetical protein ABI700_15030, partial [Chloroflexota bacterium]